jgi:hypothetical protein
VGSTLGVDPMAYKSIVESLRYLVNMRLDLVFSVLYIRLFMEKLSTEHLGMVRKVFVRNRMPVSLRREGGELGNFKP